MRIYDMLNLGSRGVKNTQGKIRGKGGKEGKGGKVRKRDSFPSPKMHVNFKF